MGLQMLAFLTDPTRTNRAFASGVSNTILTGVTIFGQKSVEVTQFDSTEIFGLKKDVKLELFKYNCLLDKDIDKVSYKDLFNSPEAMGKRYLS